MIDRYRNTGGQFFCVVFLKKKAFANIYSGWKGTLQRIGGNGVNILIEKYNSDPKDIVAVIGPTIGKCDLEVHDDVADQFKEEFGYMENIITKKDDIKSLIDLSTVASDFLYSYRRDKDGFGLMGSVVVM